MLDNTFPKHLHHVYDKLLSIHTFAKLSNIQSSSNISTEEGFLYMESDNLYIDINIIESTEKMSNSIYLQAKVMSVTIGKFNIPYYKTIYEIQCTNKYHQFFHQLQPYINQL